MLPFRNRRGETVEADEFTATVAKNEFGRILEKVIREGSLSLRNTMLPRRF